MPARVRANFAKRTLRHAICNARFDANVGAAIPYSIEQCCDTTALGATSVMVGKVMVTVDEYSLVSIPLDLRSIGNHIGTATGFFYARNDKTFLVSNWHVFSGRHPDTGQPIDKNAAIPDQAILPLHLKGKVGQWRNGFIVQLNDQNGNPTWFQHPKGQDIDVAVWQLENLPEEFTTYEAVRPNETSNMALRVGMDVFIVGFPLGISKQGHLPIWKRGSVASEPDFPVENLPMILADTATKKGMSGSPVYVRSFGNVLFESGDFSVQPKIFTRFVGVYSGRYGGDDEFAAQLGRVWHKAVLDEVIDNAMQGTFELR